jgi:hypothetical protein
LRDLVSGSNKTDMTSEEKVINYKVIILIKVYNFDVGRFAI